MTSELAEHLGTSLGPVREALHILVGEGVVDIRPNIGASVMTLSPQTFIDGLEILEVTGALALRLIAPKLKDAKVVADIERALKPVFDAGKRRNPHDFFSAIAASVGERLRRQCLLLNPILNHLRLEYFYRQMADCLPDDFWDAYTDNYRITGKHLINGGTGGRARGENMSRVIGLIRKRKLS